jgi:hypothetical protein
MKDRNGAEIKVGDRVKHRSSDRIFTVKDIDPNEPDGWCITCGCLEEHADQFKGEQLAVIPPDLTAVYERAVIEAAESLAEIFKRSEKLSDDLYEKFWEEAGKLIGKFDALHQARKDAVKQ